MLRCNHRHRIQNNNRNAAAGGNNMTTTTTAGDRVQLSTVGTASKFWWISESLPPNGMSTWGHRNSETMRPSRWGDIAPAAVRVRIKIEDHTSSCPELIFH
jgi:hypothetical protein